MAATLKVKLYNLRDDFQFIDRGERRTIIAKDPSPLLNCIFDMHRNKDQSDWVYDKAYKLVEMVLECNDIEFKNVDEFYTYGYDFTVCDELVDITKDGLLEWAKEWEFMCEEFEQKNKVKPSQNLDIRLSRGQFHQLSCMLKDLLDCAEDCY